MESAGDKKQHFFLRRSGEGFVGTVMLQSLRICQFNPLPVGDNNSLITEPGEAFCHVDMVQSQDVRNIFLGEINAPGIAAGRIL